MTASTEYVQTVILGAGPGGLATAACLGRRGLPYLLLEKGNQPCAALRRIHSGMTLVSPRRLSRLPHMERLSGQPAYMKLGSYLEALERYREQHAVVVRTGAAVEQVQSLETGLGDIEIGSHDDKRGRFRIAYRDVDGVGHAIAADFVVNCTGVVSAPRLPPDFDPKASEILWRHSRNVTPADLEASRRLLLIGGGLSAADVVGDWLQVRRPQARASMSLRSPLWVAPRRILGIDIHYFIWLPEQLPVVWPKPTTNPILGFELPRALARGDVQQVAPVSRYLADRVELEDGEVLEPDLMVFATGYSYATAHLGDLLRWPAGKRPRVRRCESLDTPNLFAIGIHFGRTYASPYLRGIGRDADYVARRIARRTRTRGSR